MNKNCNLIFKNCNLNKNGNMVTCYNFDINFFAPYILTLIVFGRQLCNRSVTFFCDNKAVTYIINKQTSPKKDIMILIRNLVLTCMQYNIVLKCLHVRGRDNVLPDKLSRLQVSESLLREFGMAKNPTEVPTHLLPSNFKGL